MAGKKQIKEENVFQDFTTPELLEFQTATSAGQGSEPVMTFLVRAGLFELNGQQKQQVHSELWDRSDSKRVRRSFNSMSVDEKMQDLIECINLDNALEWDPCYKPLVSERNRKNVKLPNYMDSQTYASIDVKPILRAGEKQEIDLILSTSCQTEAPICEEEIEEASVEVLFSDKEQQQRKFECPQQVSLDSLGYGLESYKPPHRSKVEEVRELSNAEEDALDEFRFCSNLNQKLSQEEESRSKFSVQSLRDKFRAILPDAVAPVILEHSSDIEKGEGVEVLNAPKEEKEEEPIKQKNSFFSEDFCSKDKYSDFTCSMCDRITQKAYLLLGKKKKSLYVQDRWQVHLGPLCFASHRKVYDEEKFLCRLCHMSISTGSMVSFFKVLLNDQDQVYVKEHMIMVVSQGINLVFPKAYYPPVLIIRSLEWARVLSAQTGKSSFTLYEVLSQYSGRARIRVGSKIFFSDDNQITYIYKDGDKPYDYVGGSREEVDQTFDDTISRELKNKLGIAVPKHRLGISSDSDMKNITMLFFSDVLPGSLVPYTPDIKTQLWTGRLLSFYEMLSVFQPP